MKKKYLPLHPAQPDFYTDQLANTKSPQYNIGGYIKLKGSINKEKFHEALNSAPKVSDAFKWRFDNDVAEPLCYLDQEYEKMRMEEIDFSSHDNPEAEGKSWIQDRFNTPFLITQETLPFEECLLKIADNEYWFFGRYHPLITDSYGFIGFIKYIAQKYKSLINGDEVQFSYSPCQDELANASAFVNSNDYELDSVYWKNKIGMPPPKIFSRKYRQPDNADDKSATYIFYLTPDQRKLTQEICVLTGMDIQQLTIAALLIYFGKTSEQSEFVFGIPVHQTGSKKLRNVAGKFSEILPYKGSFQRDKNLTELLKDITISLNNDYSHQNFLISELGQQGKAMPSEDYLYQVSIGYEPFNLELDFGGQLEAEIQRVSNDHERNPLQLCWLGYGYDQSLKLQVHFNNAYFNLQEIELLVKRIIFIIEQFPLTLNKNVGDIEILPAQEKILLESFNDTVSEYPKDKTIIDLFEEQVVKNPGNIALVFEERQLTYKELNDLSNQLGRYLKSKGVKEDTLVPLCIKRSVEMIVGILGILKAGAAYVPIDPEYPEERIMFMLEDSNATIIVTNKECAKKLNATVSADCIFLDSDWPAISNQSKENVKARIKRNHLAYVIYTSGSTGKPKGVMIEHGNAHSFICWCMQEFSPGSFEIVYAGTSICFDLSIFEIFYPLSIGKRLRIIENGLYIGKFLSGERNVMTNSVPAVIQSLLKEGTDISNISVMNMAGEPIPLQVQQGLDADKIEIRNLYGPTEDTTYSTVYRLKNEEPILIGRPISNTQIYIVNKKMELVPVGVAGEVCIGGAGLARGYLNREELTAEKFISNPFSKKTGARLYKTGDMGRWLPEGNIDYLGRLDDQVKVRGYRIELGEVETAMNKLDHVNGSCVVVKKDANSLNRLVAYFIPNWQLIKSKERELYISMVAGWKEIYDTEYAKTEIAAGIDPEFNIIGWNDSFTGKAIPAEQMQEWLHCIIEIIMAEKPVNVLEIGSGTGLIYYQLAGKVKKYICTDFSRSSINQISDRISKGGRDYGPTEFQVCAAHEVSLKENEKVDTVILNSIAQHFPGEEYMTDVIGKSISFLKGGGRIIVGDVRDNRLVELFKGRLQIKKVPKSTKIKDFKWAIEQEVLKEEELCFSPDYFYRLQSLYPQITHIEIKWKQGSYINELTLYRFNVIIYVGMHAEVNKPDWQSWKDIREEQSIITELQQGNIVAIKDVPNPRLWQEQLLYTGLQDKSIGTVEDLLSKISREDIETIKIRSILHNVIEKGYSYRLLPDQNLFKVNVVFEPKFSSHFIEQPYNSKAPAYNILSTNIPLFTDISALFQKDIRVLLQQSLPGYMVPSEIISLVQLPLTDNGKVDRMFLSQREERVQGTRINYESPHNEMELVIVNIWQDLLSMEAVSIHDNFFEIGGHSLLATRVVSAIRKKLNVELLIGDLFDHPTIAGLATYLGTQGKGLLIPDIEVQTRPQYIPLSYSQMRLWFIDRLEGSVQYHIPAVLRLKGRLNTDALVFALQNIVNRHEILRTVILENEGEPYQFIMPEDGFMLTVIDGSLYKNNLKELQKNVRRLINAPFNLSKDHMLRAALITLNDQEHELVVTTHHIASDGWSLSITVKEVVELYKSYIEGGHGQLPPLEIQYADFAIWQRKYLQGEVLDRKSGYWKEKLQGVTPLQLPLDYARPVIQSKKGANANFRINKQLTSALQLLSQQQGTTLFMTLLAAFKVLLYRYTGQQDICVGTPIAGRQQHELEGLIGYFINTLVLRSRLIGNASFKDLLQQIRTTTMEAYEHQEVPFEKVVEAVVKERDLSRTPLFQVMMVLQNTPVIQQLRLEEGVQLSRGLAESTAHNTAKFDLTLFITETVWGLKCTVEYCTGLYSEQTIKKMMAHFNELLNSVVRAPEQRIGLLPMLINSEEQQLLRDFNNTASGYNISKTIVDLFEEQVEKHPTNIALVFDEQQLTYRQLNERSNQLARYLQTKGVKEGTLVPVCIERSVEMLIGILGIIKAGGAYVPIDPEYPKERIGFMLEDTAALIVISNKQSRRKLPADNHINIIEIDSDSPFISKERVDNLKVDIHPDNLAYVIYTSGSTGKPKGVMVTQKNVVSLVKGIDYISLTSQDVLLSTGSSSFDATTFEYWGMLLNGGGLVLCTENRLLDNKLLKEEMNNRGVNRMWFTSSWFNQLVEADITLFEKLETVLVGGEKLSEHHIGKLRQTYPGIEIINGYGPTENTTFSLTYNITETEINQPIPIGRPLSNRSAFILDENQQLVPVGVSGEICLSGAGIARGYLNRAELTAEKFIKNPFSTEQGSMMYKSGDLGRWLADGNIEFLGRIDEQVKIRGYRIELGELESVLHQCELVAHAVVVAKDDNIGNKRLVSYIVPVQKFNKEGIVSYLRGKVPEYMVPSIWIELEHLPLTSNGKIDKKALPDTDISQLCVNQYEAPRNEMETRLAVIWQDLLGIEEIGIHDNFFGLGGHSLHAMRLVSIIKRKMEMDISINDVFIYPTIAGLIGNFIEKSRNPSLAAFNIKYLVPIKAPGTKVPLYIMAGGGGTALRFKKFSDLLEADQPVYVLQPPIDSKKLKEFPDNIEGIANKFIDEIVIQNPEGPYALSGHCLGGIIAFEMAKQLQARGKKVQLLALFDTIISEAVNPEPGTLKNLFHIPAAIRTSISKLIVKVDFQTFLLRNHARQSMQYKINAFRYFLDRIKRKKLNALELEYAGLEVFDKSAEIYVKACKNYKLSPFNGAIILFYAKEHYFFLDREKNVGFKKLYLDESTKNMWKQYADTVFIHEVEGEHSEIFDPVHGNEFALVLQQHLNNAGK